MDNGDNAAKIVSSALLGLDYKVVIVGSKSYAIPPPTIRRIAGAAYWLSGITGGDTIRELLASVNDAGALAHALSWFINGDDSLHEELSAGTLDEVAAGLEAAYSLISVESFSKLLALARNVARLAANPR